MVSKDFYPRPPRGGRRGSCPALRTIAVFLSTPSARRATVHCNHSTCRVRFLSTPSARRATIPKNPSACPRSYFYPRPPRGGRLFASTLFPEGVVFLSARRATFLLLMVLTSFMVFLSTPSARRATRGMRRGSPGLRNFYPRPPRGGRPMPGTRSIRRMRNFYPRPPRGGRPLVIQPFGQTLEDFYPRPPRGGRQGVYICEACGSDISIHALRATAGR